MAARRGVTMEPASPFRRGRGTLVTHTALTEGNRMAGQDPPLRVPRYEVEVYVDASGRLLPVSAEDAAEGFGDNRDYHDLRGISWLEATDAVGREMDLLATASLGDTAEAFEQAVEELEDVIGDEINPLFWTVDLGVTGLVATLSAAGYVTTYSCRGHPHGRGCAHPVVRLACDQPRLEVLASCATDVGCGLSVNGLVEVWDTSVAGLLRLAQEILKRRDEFGHLPALELSDGDGPTGQTVEGKGLQPGPDQLPLF
jgi:hypothetical protein